jgi:hypothetical protein
VDRADRGAVPDELLVGRSTLIGIAGLTHRQRGAVHQAVERALQWLGTRQPPFVVRAGLAAQLERLPGQPRFGVAAPGAADDPPVRGAAVAHGADGG